MDPVQAIQVTASCAVARALLAGHIRGEAPPPVWGVTPENLCWRSQRRESIVYLYCFELVILCPGSRFGHDLC